MQADSTTPNAGSMERALRALMLLLVIGPLWLMTRNLFDGAPTAHAEMIGNFDGVYYWTTNANWPLAVLLYKACNALAGLLSLPFLPVMKLVITALLLGLYAELTRLARELFAFGESESRCVALICLASPSLYTLVSTTIAPILLCVWLVFAGHRLFRSGDLRLRFAGLALLALSFQLASNLVLSMALELAFMLRYPERRQPRLKWLALLAATAVTVYASMRLLSPPKLIFVEHNLLLNPFRPDDLRRIIKATLMFLTWGVIPLAAMLLALLAGGLAQRGVRVDRDALRDRSSWQMILICMLLCAAAAFPYVMVGKGPPLFTLRSMGEGITEQVLRAAHTGWFAPTWPNTSGRHGFLYSIGIALLSWQLARLVLNALGPGRMSGKPVRQFLLLAPLMLAWLLPAYGNKLRHQYTEESLVKALKALPPAPAGIVELHYSPVTDYVIWTTSAGVVLRQAWGRSDYYAMFHSVPAYLADMQWSYHAYLQDPGLLQTQRMQNFYAMSNFPGERCLTQYEAQLPQPAWTDVVLGGVFPGRVEPARVVQTYSGCRADYRVPNPTPDKKLIP